MQSVCRSQDKRRRKMSENRVFYLCPTCFEAYPATRLDDETDGWCHRHPLIRCQAAQLDDERRKPLVDNGGCLTSRAPRWFLEAVGWVAPRGSAV
jgi:hypothetical protein